MAHLRGETHGMAWVEIDIDVPDTLLTPATRSATGRLRIVSPADRPIPDYVIRMICTPKAYLPHYLSAEIGFRPFDEAAELPGCRVAYHREGFRDFDVAKWAETRIAAPEGVDLSLEYDHWHRRLYAYATTLRNGAVTKVRRKVHDALPFVETMGPVLRYFERNCPRVEEGHRSVTVCGTHVNELISHLNSVGVEQMRRWAERTAVETERYVGAITITPEMMPGVERVAKVVITKAERGAAAHARIDFEGGTLVDDEQGITVTLTTTLPDVLLSALRGRPLTDIIAHPWMRGLMIRTARQEEGKKIGYMEDRRGPAKLVIRAFALQEPMRVPENVAEDREEIARQLRAIVAGDRPRIKLLNEDARAVLARMDANTLLAVLTLLDANGRVELEPHGHPGWTLRKMGLAVEVDRCPTQEIAPLIEEVLGRGA